MSVPRSMKDAVEKYNVPRILECRKAHREAMNPFLEVRRDVLNVIGGRSFGNAGSKSPSPIPIMGNTLRTYGAHVAGGNPVADVTCEFDDYQPQARELEVYLNHEIERLNLKDTFRTVLNDAFVRIGIAKIGLEPGGLVSYGGAEHEATQVFVAPIDIEDALLDMSVGNFLDSAYIGDMYWVDLEWAQKFRGYNETGRSKLVVESPDEVDEFGNKTSATIGTTLDALESTVRERVRLMDVYLPVENVILTMPVTQSEGDPILLKWAEWEGPPNPLGPYRLVGFYKIGKIPMFHSLSDAIMDLHLLCNVLWEKLKDEAINQKTVLGASLGSDQDATRLKNARNGQVVSVANVNGIKPFSFSGADPGTAGFFNIATMAANKYGGNTDMLSGQGQIADTATQEMMIAQNSNVIISDIEAIFHDFCADVIGDVAWYLWDQPYNKFEFYDSVPGTPYRVKKTFDSTRKDGKIKDFRFRVRQFSMQSDNAGRELNNVMQYIERIYVPLAQQAQAQGIQLDLTELTRVFVKLKGCYSLNNIAKVTAPTNTGEAEEPGKPANTTRTEIRRSVGGGDQNPTESWAGDLSSNARHNAMIAAQTPQ